VLLRSRAGRPAVFPALLFFAASFFPCVAAAEGLSGYADVGYTTFTSQSTSTSGIVSNTDSRIVTQRYNLTYNRTLYPYLRLYANGLFDKADSSATINGTRADLTTTTILPTLDLTLRTPVYIAGANFNRRIDTTSFSAAPTTTRYNDFSQAMLGWRPPDRYLPYVEMRFSRSHTYDRDRISQDVVLDTAGLSVDYQPTDYLTLRYRPTYNDATNKLTGLETTELTQTGRVDYARSFLQNRISFGTSYNISTSERKISFSGTGFVDIAVLPFAGLSSIDDTPTDGALASNVALIDGNLTASAGINIGLPPLVGGDTRERNIGIDFSLEKEVNTLKVWVDRDLPSAIAGSFSWNVYTSRDNLTWNLLATVFPATFGPFENSFEVAFPSVTARYIKVAVRPLSAAVPGSSGFPDIFVTELQAFSRKSAEQVRGKSASKNDSFSFDGRALLLESANLYYTLTYFLTRSDPSSVERWTLSNGLTASQRFGRVFSGAARVGRDDFSEPGGNGYAYTANMSLDAVPLRALHHSLGYTGRFQETDIGRSNSNSFFLNNYVEVYSGVNLTASGGLNFLDTETGAHSRSTDLNGSVNIVPYRTLNLNYFVTSRISEISGEAGSSSARNTTTGVGATYYPVPSLYLVAGASAISDNEGTRRQQNFALNWSPFLGGAIQFSFDYTESMGSEKNSRTRIYGPHLTWKVTQTTYLNATYQVLSSESDDGKSHSDTFSTNIRAYF
jgi:hypothetical protein